MSCYLDSVNSISPINSINLANGSMKTLLFYTLNPAGNKILLSSLLREMLADNRNKWLEKSEMLRGILGDAHYLYMSTGRAPAWLILKALSGPYPDRHEVIIPATPFQTLL